MPRQILTIEISYSLFDDDGEPRDEPMHWPLESALDHYSGCQGVESTYTRYVRVIQSSPTVYDERDEEDAQEHETSLLEMGIIR